MLACVLLVLVTRACLFGDRLFTDTTVLPSLLTGLYICDCVYLFAGRPVLLRWSVHLSPPRAQGWEQSWGGLSAAGVGCVLPATLV